MDQLYKQELMEVFKNPVNRGHLESPSVSVHKNNPMCGDALTLQLKLNKGVIEDAKFDGVACAVSIISADLVTDFIKGKSIEDAKKLTKDDVLDLIGLNLTTSRVKCATLILSALHGALDA